MSGSLAIYYYDQMKSLGFLYHQKINCIGSLGKLVSLNFSAEIPSHFLT